MKRKVTLNDDFFFDNGYFILKSCESPVTKYNPTGGWKYDYVQSTEKWRKLMDTIFRTHDLNKIITPELLIKTIQGKTTRTPKAKNRYKKIERPEGYLTTKEKLAIAKEKRIAKGWKPSKGNKLLKNDN